MVDLRSAHGTYRPAPHRTRRTQCALFEGTVERVEFCQGVHQSASARDPDLRTGRLWRSVEIDRDLVEWDYGDYEGRRTLDIHKERPDWQLFHDGCPGGESPADVGVRADRIVQRLRAVDDDVLVFSSGHFLRVFAARWLGLEAAIGRCFMLSTASLSAVSYEHKLSQPAIRLWDDTRHVAE